ncbi:hypothetical protein Ancab_034368 [Ancistrocladus abbreviatus]
MEFAYWVVEYPRGAYNIGLQSAATLQRSIWSLTGIQSPIFSSLGLCCNSLNESIMQRRLVEMLSLSLTKGKRKFGMGNKLVSALSGLGMNVKCADALTN